MKLFFTILLLSIHSSASTFIEVPNKFNESIKLTSPKNNLITINDRLKIAGRANNNVSVTVNGNKLSINENGQFEYFEKIHDLGKQSVIVEFNTDKESFSLKRDFIKLKNPKTVIMTQKELAFINTKLVSNRIKRQSLTNKFLRDELAFFLSKITLKSTETNKKIQNLNNLRRYQTEIQSVINSNILSLNQNGDFKPNEEVKLIIFLTGVANALGYEPSEEVYPEIGKFKGKWFYDFLKIGLDKKIITTKDISKIQMPLTNALFIKYSSKIPELNHEIIAELNFDTILQKSSTTITEIKAPKTSLSNKTTLTINKVVELSSYTKEIQGKVNPARAFSVNWKKVSPNESGEFTLKIPSKQSRIQFNFGNELIVKDVNTQKLMNIEITESTPETSNQTEKTIEPYRDISKHWISQIANQLKLEGKLSDTNNFNPNKKISRAELAKFIVEINGVKNKDTNLQFFNDIKPSNPNFKEIQTVVSNKLFNGISSKRFAPQENVTKIQAIIVASRLLPELNDYSSIKLPYRDIGKYNWADKNIRKAYHYKIISSAETLHPKKEITKAELISLLYKTSKI